MSQAKRIITLTTDWGLEDHYVASVKGKLLAKIPENVYIVDISHRIPKFNIFPAAFTLRNCMHEFPEGTIHIIGVNAEATINTPHIAALYKGQYFISADNGIFSLLFDEKPDKIVEIDIYQDSNYLSFPTKDVFAKTAIAILEGQDTSSIGHEVSQIRECLGYAQPPAENDTLLGIIVHIDTFSNIITNIRYKEFASFVKGKRYSISFSTYSLNKVHNSYNDVEQGFLVAFFNSSGLLEIAINQGEAASLLGLKFNDSIIIQLSPK